MIRLFCASFVSCVFVLVSAQAATFRISEFLAENDGGLVDSDGETPDWIEIENTSAGIANLGGWRLTDSATNLTKWTFPATNLAAGGRLIVFASGKDRATNGAQLHANFRLENNGGYLALVDSNGVIASEFNYPQQHRNVSFGPSSSNAPPVTLLAPGAPARWFVPASGSLETTWTAPGFDASTWSNANTPLRFDPGAGVVGPPVLSVDFNDDDSGESGAANTEAGFSTMALSNNPASFDGITVQLSAINGGVLDDRDRATPTQGGSLTLDQIYDDCIFVVGQTNGNGARIQITGLVSSQNYQLRMWSFDSSSFQPRVSDWTETASGITRVITNGYTFDGNVLPTNDTNNTFGGLLTASAGGALTIEGRRNGGSSHGVFMNGLQLSPVNSTTASGNVATMFGANASIYARIPFNMGSTSQLSSVTLRVRYNDGFVAYLNGTEVARRNAPAVPDWTSAATATHSSAVSEDIVLPAALGAIASGNNVLAIHGLNIAATNSDFFLEPQLTATFALSATNGFYSPVTPGTANGPSFFGVVADTKFSVDRGFYDAPFSLSITSATPGATIYFTTNGGAPSLTNGSVHSSPIQITGNSFIRAQAYLQGWIPSGIDTHSYIFLRDVLRQSNNIPNYPTIWQQATYPADYEMDSNVVNHPSYSGTISNDLRSIPTLSIVTEHDGLWGPVNGIYNHATSEGPQWERAASVELIHQDGRTEFAVTCGLQMQGNASRDNTRTPKHNIRLLFKSDYGPTRLEYDWFPGPHDTFNTMVLRACFTDSWATRSSPGDGGARYRPDDSIYLRDVWTKDSLADMGWLSGRGDFVHLYINGLYWGLYNPSERLDDSYFAEQLGGREEDWDVIRDFSEVLAGSKAEWDRMMALVNAGVTTEAAYQAIRQEVDVENLIDYMLLHIFSEAEDWPHHNWYAARRRATNGLPATKWIFLAWDQEIVLDQLVRRNRIDVNNDDTPARIYSQLRAYPEFRRLFGDRVHKHLLNGGALTPSNNIVRLQKRVAQIDRAIVGESARWGDAREFTIGPNPGTGRTFTRDEYFVPELDKLYTNFLQKLTVENIARFRAGNLYPNVGAPEFNPFGGSISNGFQLVITHTNASGVIYFTTDGSDPRVYGSGAVAAGAQSFSAPIPVNTPTFVRARVLQAGNWSALVEALFSPPQDLSGLALTEIMYNPPDLGPIDGEEFEFIELKNYGTNTLNLLGLTFQGIGFTWTSNTMLAPGEFVVLVRNASVFATKYPGVAIHGQYSGSLNNAGEQITLAHTFGGNIFSVTYDDVAPWPVTPDGIGFSLVPLNPGQTQAPDSGQRWRASTVAGGSPGADDPAPVIPPIVINELLSNPAGAQVDMLELLNPTASPVDIGGWFLTDDPETPMKYRIANGTVIAANGYVLFDEIAHFNPTPGTNNSFAFSGAGEQVYLFSGDANTNLTGYSHGFEFEAADPGVPFARHINSVGEEQFPAERQNSFGHPNAGPRVGSIVINEIHYNPAVGDDEFVELKNIRVDPVSLFDPVYTANAWKLNGVGFTFPTNVTVPAQGLVLVVATNPAAFIAKYSVPSNVLVFGPWSGALDNSGERVEATKPQFLNTNSPPPFVAEDSVRYNDRAPWPPAADGSGASLQRQRAHHHGDDPINWIAAAPTPGRELDRDSDGMPDFWETVYGLDPMVADGNGDPDSDGATNLQEFVAGTNPLSGQSALRFDEVRLSGTNVNLRFTIPSNRVYRVLFKDTLDAPSWTLLREMDMRSQNRSAVIAETTTNVTRFYRLTAP